MKSVKPKIINFQLSVDVLLVSIVKTSRGGAHAE